MDKKIRTLPELLSPAGSPHALEAAIDGGADAVYFGGSAFNARMGAKNFDKVAIEEYVRLAHSYGVKCYVTLNTLVADRELHSCVRFAAECCEAGVDALIVADLGVASVLKRAIPSIVLHASTQASGHNTYAARELERLGFSRMVMAREATLRDVALFTSKSAMELEVFVHGALCVSHSGQCLFSSLVGGRSGNRGECAQPCRLPYGNGTYPLSLKDLCLASHIPELISAGVASLKIEGRMKSAEYVRAVTHVYRRLLDEGRAATREEIEYLSGVFSRDGFTDGYFTSAIDRKMLGRRSEEDKSITRALPAFRGIERKLDVNIAATVKADESISFTVSRGEHSVTVLGDKPETAQSAPMTREDYARSFSRLGATPYRAENIEIDCDEDLMVPVSKLNALRREGIDAFVKEFSGHTSVSCDVNCADAIRCLRPAGSRENERSARFVSPGQITDDCRKYFDRLYLPLERYDGSTDSVIMPPVIFERELESAERMLENAKRLGARHILVGNIGHIELAKKYGFVIHGDFRLNAVSSPSVATLLSLGMEDVILSPELSLARIRDIAGPVSAIVYGRIPLMLLEKCVIRECASCKGYNGDQICSTYLTDRKGIKFPVLREGTGHRNTVVNSIPTCMSDRQDELDAYSVTSRHFIFTVETREEIDRVIDAFLGKQSVGGDVRRIVK